MANNQQMTFSLGIKTTADMTGLNQLKKSLQELSTYTTDDSWLATSEFSPQKITQITSSVNTLGNALDAAFDVNLNGINFSTFQKSLKASGTSLSEIGKNMAALGPQGEAAFAQATAQVFKMNTAVQYSNKIVNKLWEAFGNTVKYTAFNAAINSITGSAQKAVGYIKDLDRSLNDIRIVSGQSAEQMGEFAQKANEAAKTLGSSTTDYTDAALIYYQQGLTGEQVAERTDVTQKMANVTGESAQQVSEDLTAIWNNFYDGSKSLEYYADVITALGASTASSSEEIAQGLEKFAAVAGTVGLSYEYATSALATVVAETRQSADTVGTAFKTLFARIQGLSLGETLDDGTNLTKYSKALLQVGINIKDSNGELKTMDTILDEMGSKWQSLNKDQQVALAQTVAGTRQYTQLVALMEKWDVFKDNLNTTADATGTLQKQQDIYMERTQAHLEKLGAAAEDLYASLFDTKDLNKWIDRITGLIEQIDNLVEVMGGLNGILPMLMAGGMSAFSGKIATGISQSMTNKRNDREAMTDQQAKADFLNLGGISDVNTSGTQTSAELEKQVKWYQEMYGYAKNMTEEERNRFINLVESGTKLVEAKATLEDESHSLSSKNALIKIGEEELNDEVALQRALTEGIAQAIGALKDFNEWAMEGDKNITDIDEIVGQLASKFDRLNSKGIENAIKMGEDGLIIDPRATEQAFNEMIQGYDKVGKAANTYVSQVQSVTNAQKTMSSDMSQRQQIENYLQLASAIGQVASSINIIKNIGNILADGNLSGEELLQTLMNLSFALPMLYNSFSKIKSSGSKLLEGVRGSVSTKEIKAQELVIEEAQAKKIKAIEERKAADKILANKKAYLETQKTKLEELKNQALFYAEDAKNKDVAEKEKQLSIQQTFVKEIEMEKLRSEMNARYSRDVLGDEELAARYDMQASSYDRKLTSEYAKEKLALDELNKARAQDISMLDSEAISRINNEIATQENIVTEAEDGVVTAEVALTKTAETVIETTNTVAKEENTLATITNALSSGTLTWALIKETAAKVANTVATIASNLAQLASNKILLAVAVAVGVAIAAYEIYTSVIKINQKAATDSAEKNSEASRKLTEKYKEQYDSITSLADAYEKLGKRLEELSTTELRNEAYQLCIQYREEGLAVKALSADYEELKDIIKETQAARSKKLNDSAKQTKESQEKTIAKKLEQEAGLRHDSVNGKDTIDLKGMYLIDNTDEFNQVAALTDLAEEYGIEDLFVNNDHIDSEKLSQLLSSDQKGVRDILEKYDTKMADQLLGYFDNLSEDLDKLVSDAELYKEATLDNIVQNLKDSDVSSENYLNTRKKIISELISTGQYANTEEGKAEIERAVNTALMGASSEGLKNTKAYTLASELGNINRYYNILTNLNDAQTQLVSKFSSYIKITGKDIEKFLANTETYLEKIVSETDFSSISVSLEAATESGEFTEKDIDTLFPSDGYTLKVTADVEVDRDEFEKLDFSTQSMYASQALITALQNNDAEAYYTGQIKAIEEMIQEIKKIQNFEFGGINSWSADSIEIYKNNLKYLKNLIKEEESTINVEEFSENASNEVVNTLNEVLDNSEATYQNYVDALKEAGLDNYAQYIRDNNLTNLNVTVSDTDSLKNTVMYLKNIAQYSGAIAQIESQTEAISSLMSAQDELKNSEIDVVQLNKDIENNYKNLDSTIDHLQSQYSSLQSIVDDYNDNHKLSVDSIQTLVKMDNAFVASLEFENDQLRINGENYSSLMDIQMAYMRQQVMNDLIADIHVITMDSVADATDSAKNATETFSGSITEAVNNMKAGQSAFSTWVATAGLLAGVDMNKYGDRIDEAVTAAYNKLKLIESADYFGSSSGSGSSSKKDEKEWKDEYDRYWDINNAIDKVTHALSQLDKQEEKLSRNELISALKTENELLETQAQKYQDLAAEQKKEASELQEVLSGYGIIFDDQGQIQNYLAQTQQYLDDYNAAVSAYNTGTLSDEGFDVYEKEYEKFKDTLDKYDELYYDKMVETQDKLDEIGRQIKENNLTGWETELELVLETKEAERNWNDFLGKIEDNFKSKYTDFTTQFRTAMFDATSLGGDNGSLQADMKAVQDVIAEINKMEAGQDSNMFESISQAQEKLKELQSTMKDDAESLFDLYQEGWDRYIDAIGEVQDKFSDLRDDFGRINDDLDHQSKMIELLYGENAYSYLDQLYQAQSNNYLSQMASLRDQGEFFKQQYEEAAATFGEDSDAANAFKEAWEEVIDELHSTEEAYIQKLADTYANTIAEAFHKAEQSLMNGSSYNFVSDQWDKAKKSAEGVYDEQERIYQLEKLGSKYNDAINKASSTKSQQKLQDLYESQVASLEDKNRLTEYDVQLAEKRLAVAEAEAALEDAQNAKNALKVTRNEAGNWTYQYVADDSDIDDKQQALLDAQYEAYEYVKQNVSDMKEAMIELAEEWSNTISDLEAKMIGATEEEKVQYQEMIDWYNEYYANEMSIKTEELALHETQLAQETNALLRTEYNINEEAYGLMTESQKACIDSLQEHAIESATDVYNAVGETYDEINEYGDIAMRETISYFSTAASEITDVWVNNPDSVKNAMLDALETCKQAQIDYTIAVEEGCVAAGEAYTDVENQINENIDTTNELSDVTSDMIENAINELDYYEDSVLYLQSCWDGVRQAILDNQNQIDEYLGHLGQAIQKAVELTDILREAKSLQAELDGGNRDEYSNYNPDNYDNTRYSIQNQFGGNYGIWDNVNKNWADTKDFGYSNTISGSSNAYYELEKLLNENNFSGFGIQKYATGGYTGEWNNSSEDGRLAFLHQKELVLNADDTENMLATVSAVRDLSSISSSIQQAIADSIANALMKVSGLTSDIGGNTVSNNNSSNNYVINADFPAANNVDDIREALLSLPNLAAQRIGQKNL